MVPIKMKYKNVSHFAALHGQVLSEHLKDLHLLMNLENVPQAQLDRSALLWESNILHVSCLLSLSGDFKFLVKICMCKHVLHKMLLYATHY